MMGILMSKVLLLNGVNLCMLGKGHGKFATDYKLRDVESTVVAAARLKGVDVVSKSTNSESVMIDTIHVAKSSGISCILINASSHAYTSFALVDALSSVDLDYVDIQLNINII